jgi:hypothetical protein
MALTEVRFQTSRIWRPIYRLEIKLDIVTGIIVGDQAITFRPSEEIEAADGVIASVEHRARLRPQIAERLARFCLAAYAEDVPAPSSPLFDCHSALAYWLGATQNVVLGTGISQFRYRTVGHEDPKGKPGKGYVVCSPMPNHFPPHSYMSIAKKSEACPEMTLSPLGDNGELAITEQPWLVMAFSRGRGSVSELTPLAEHPPCPIVPLPVFTQLDEHAPDAYDGLAAA